MPKGTATFPTSCSSAAHRSRANSPPPNPNPPPIAGYEVAPVLYLLGPDGTVKWTDQAARFHHKEPKEIAAELDAAVAKELDALPR